MEKGYKSIFWGVFLASFSITLGPTRLGPPFIGWMIVLSGINHLKEVHDNLPLREAGKYNKFLVFFSLLGSLVDFMGNRALITPLILSYYPIITSVFELLMVFKIIEGSIEYFRFIQEEKLSLEFEIEQRTYTVLQIIGIIVFLVSSTIQNEFFMTLTAVFLIVVRIYVMVSMRKLRKIVMEE